MASAVGVATFETVDFAMSFAAGGAFLVPLLCTGQLLGLLSPGFSDNLSERNQVFHKTPPSHSEEPPKSSDRRTLPTSCGRRSRSGVPSTTRVV